MGKLLSDPLFQIYFGDAADGLHPSFYAQWRDMNIVSQAPIVPIAKQLELSNLLLLRQTHSIKGAIIDSSNNDNSAFFAEGDFLCTDQTAIGIGVMTADCVPVVCIDRAKKVVAIAHAGWRGAIDNIMQEFIVSLQARWSSNLFDLEIVIGPSAKACCYEVSQDFIEYLAPYDYKDELLARVGTQLRFDVSELVKRQLVDLGIQPSAISSEYNLCTMCNHHYYSHRRGTLEKNATAVGRQITVVALR